MLASNFLANSPVKVNTGFKQTFYIKNMRISHPNIFEWVWYLSLLQKSKADVKIYYIPSKSIRNKIKIKDKTNFGGHRVQSGEAAPGMVWVVNGHHMKLLKSNLIFSKSFQL